MVLCTVQCSAVYALNGNKLCAMSYSVLRPQFKTALFIFIFGLPRGVCASIFSSVFVFSGNENEKWVRICTHPLCRISGPKVQF